MDLEHERRLTDVEARTKSNAKRLDEVEKRQDNLDKLVVSVSNLANEQTHIKDDVGEIKSNVKTLMSKSGKIWDSIVEKSLWALVGAVIVFILGRLGL